MIDILERHSIEAKTVKGQIFALETYFDTKTKESGFKWVNVTEWTKKEVYTWLGY